MFHVVVRHRSFRAAAAELGVSPQAVSQQVRLLEDALGQPLFDRRGRAITANPQALLLAEFVQSAFDDLALGIRRVARPAQRNRVNVNASPHFATRYLVDRMAGFRAAVPDTDLRLTTMVDLPDFLADDVDVAIQWGFGQWKGCEATRLLSDPKVICCTPGLARRIAGPQDLGRVPLLHPVLAPGLWPRILAHLGVPPRGDAGDIHLQDAATMHRGALAGLGVGLLSAIDAADDLDQGRLVAPLGRQVMQSMPEEDCPGFYLVLPRAHRRLRTIRAFCTWIESQDWSAPLSASPDTRTLA